MKKQLYFLTVAIIVFAAFISCHNEIGGLDFSKGIIIVTNSQGFNSESYQNSPYINIEKMDGGANVDWGDGTTETVVRSSAYLSHQYSSEGSHTITIKGNVYNMRIGDSSLVNLDISKSALESLFLGCSGNLILNCPTLYDLSASGMYKYKGSIETLDVSGCTALKWLKCGYNQLTSLNVSGCTALEVLRCGSNQLTSLDVSGCTALKDLSCDYNQLTSLDVSRCTALESLGCSNNQLTSLDVSRCTALTQLYCDFNQLTNLDVSGCTALESLSCFKNQLTSLNVSGCTALESLNCGYNQLTSLNVSGCTALCIDSFVLSISSNQFSASALNSVFATLPIRDNNPTISIWGNPGTNDCDKSIAENRGWVVE